MKLKDFLQGSQAGRSGILFADKVSFGNALIRRENLEDYTLLKWNVYCKTPMEQAKEILCAYLALKKAPLPSFPDVNGGVYMMFNLLRKGAFKTLPDSSVSIRTAEEVLRRINEMRENGVTGELKKDAAGNERLRELMAISEKYEEDLKAADAYDKALILRETLRIMEEKGADALTHVPGAANSYVGVLSDCKWSVSEKEFIEKFSGLTQGGGAENVEYAEKKKDIGGNFYKARGGAAEAAFVASEILADKGMSYGQVAVYYASPVFIHYLRAEFEADHIPYKVTEGYPATETDLVSLMLSILDTADADFTYSSVAGVVRNRKLSFENVIDKKEKIYINPVNEYRKAMRAAIGWGADRYGEYLESIKTGEPVEDSYDDKEKFSKDYAAYRKKLLFAQFLVDMTELFDGESSVSGLFGKILKFTRKYTFKRNEEKAVLDKALDVMAGQLVYLDDSSFTLKEKTGFIRRMLSGMSVDDNEKTESTVVLCPVNSVFLPERKYNYVIGMTAEGFTIDDKQSPLLSDDEKIKYICGAGEADTSVDLALRRNDRRKEAVIRSFGLLDNSAKLSFSYSYYDTVGLRESAPAVLFLELSAGSNVTALPSYEGMPYICDNDIEIKKDSVRTMSEARHNVLIERKEKDRNKEKDRDMNKNREGEIQKDDKTRFPKDGVILNTMSASRLQLLLGCPLRYYYHYDCGFSDDTPAEPSGHQWLDAVSKGNLFHYTMEGYIRRAMPPAGDGKAIDDVAFEEEYREAVGKVLKELPYVSKTIYDRELKETKDQIKEYLDHMHRSWNIALPDGVTRKLIGSELSFGPEEEIYVRYCGEGYTLNMIGFIDRVDGYIDADGILKIRIIDYKTGSRSKKIKEVKAGKQVQHYLYTSAMEGYLASENGKKHIKELFADELAALGIEWINGFEFEWIGYVFPYETEKNLEYDVTGDVLELKNDQEEETCADDQAEETDVDEQTEADDQTEEERDGVRFPENVCEVLDMTIGCRLTGKADEVIRNMEVLVNKRIKESKLKDHCSNNYCGFKDICRKWIGISLSGEEEDDNE